jgi:hypothetical protein
MMAWPFECSSNVDPLFIRINNYLTEKSVPLLVKKYDGAGGITTELRAIQAFHVLKYMETNKVINEKIEIQNEGEKNECDLIQLPTPPEKDKLNDLQISANAAYIRCGEQLFYINKSKKVCVPVNTSQINLKNFDETLKPASETKTLTKEELKQILSITGHQHIDIGSAIKSMQNRCYWSHNPDLVTLCVRTLSRAGLINDLNDVSEHVELPKYVTDKVVATAKK